jgi:hypothetical protein
LVGSAVPVVESAPGAAVDGVSVAGAVPVGPATPPVAIGAEEAVLGVLVSGVVAAV